MTFFEAFLQLYCIPVLPIAGISIAVVLGAGMLALLVDSIGNKHFKPDTITHQQRTDAEWLAKLIIERYTALGYCHREMRLNRIGNVYRSRVHKVQFEIIVIEPGIIRLKIRLSKMGLFGSVRSMLPTGRR